MFTNIKYAYYGLSKRIVSSLLAIIQLSICFTFIYFIIQGNSTVGSEVERITSIFNGRYIYGAAIHDDLKILSNKEEFENSKKFFAYLKENPNFIHVTYSDSAINLENFHGINKVMAPGGNGDHYSWVKCIDIGENFMNTFKFQMDNGRIFSNSDFNKSFNETIPVILGYNYKEFFKVDDEIKYRNQYGGGTRTLKVIGFLKENYYFVSNSNSGFYTINLDSYVIYPKQSVENTMSLKIGQEGYDDMKNLLELRYLRDSLIVINTDNFKEKDTILNDINEQVKKLYLQGDINLENLTNKSDTLINNFNSSVRELKSLAYITMLFTSIGMISTSLDSIRKRFKEFGVHLAYGCTLINILKRILYEIIILTTISLFLSIIFITIINKSYGLNVTIIDLMSLLKLIVFSIILALIIWIPSAIKVLKSEPTNLMKR